MIFCFQLILISVLVFTLLALYFDERRKNLLKIPRGRITGFWEGAERRRHFRVDADMPVRYSLTKGTTNFKAAKTKNISAGGICISIKEKLTPMDTVSLEIDMDGSRGFVIAKGEVMWVKEGPKQEGTEGVRHFDVGLEFKDLSNRDKDKLFNFITEYGKVQIEQH